MKKEIRSILKKTAKAAGITCLATGAVALVASGAALKAVSDGFHYAQSSVRKLLAQPTDTDNKE